MDIGRFDLAVIGGGEAGIAAAVRAAEMKARVCLIEQSSQLGGACVATGTLPSKTFSISAGMLELANKLKAFGVRVEGSVSLDFTEVQASRFRLTKCDQGVIQAHLKSHKINLIQGRAILLSRNRILVETEPGKTGEIEAPRIVLATGSRPAEIPGLPTDGKAVLSTDDLVGLNELPKQLLILGAGVIGCEYAFIFESFGSEVVLMEKLDHALPGQDKDIVLQIEREFKKRGIRFLAATTVTRFAGTPDGRLLAVTDKDEQVMTEKAVVCVGRTPHTQGLGLEAAGVQTGTRGEAIVDGRLETTAPGVFAAGDVLGRRMLSSTAILEGMTAAENAMGGHREWDERIVPSGIFTQPEIGAVGLTEDEAAAKGIPILVGKCSYTGLVKACALYSYMPGFIKLIFVKEGRRLAGAHIIGEDAAEIIHLPAMAMRLGARAEDFIHSIYHHPSISEGFREAARDALK